PGRRIRGQVTTRTFDRKMRCHVTLREYSFEVMSSSGVSADELLTRLRDTLASRAGDAASVLVHERAQPAQPASLGVLRPRLPPPLAQALIASGIRQLYAHQVATVTVLRERRNVVLASPTASGKTLAFALPTLERAIQQPGARALYLYPTKAL